MSMYAGRPSSWRRHRVMDSGRMLKRRVSNGLLGSRSPCRSGLSHVGWWRCGEFGCGSPRLLVAITNGGEVVSVVPKRSSFDVVRVGADPRLTFSLTVLPM